MQPVPFVVIFIMLNGEGYLPFGNASATPMINDLWYKNAVIYCLSVATYMDANGDGIGDFQGLVRRLDYLHGLGVTAIWLMPFQPSPYRDDRIHPWSQAARHSCDHRSRGQSYLRSASVVSTGAQRSQLEISRLVRLVR
jgi:hypothetical protein